MSAVFEAVAASAGNALRNGADDETGDGGAEEGSRVRGEVEVLITRYAVDVRWSFLHWLVEVGGIVFVGYTLWKSWRATGRAIPLWGSSTLAVLSRGAQVTDVFSGAETLDEMEARARAVGVVLVDGRIVEVEGAVEMDEFMMVEGQGGKFHMQEQRRQPGYGYGQGQTEVVMVPHASD